MNSGRRKTTRHSLQPESLERRQLLAASIMDTAPAETQPAMVGSQSAGHVASGPVAYIVNGQVTSNYESVGNVNEGCTGTLISPTHS